MLLQSEKKEMEVHRPGHWAGAGEESRSSRHLSMQAVPWKWWAEGVAGTPLSFSLSDQWALSMHSNSYSPHSSTSVFSCGHSCWCTETDLLHAAVLLCWCTLWANNAHWAETLSDYDNRKSLISSRSLTNDREIRNSWTEHCPNSESDFHRSCT